MKINFISFVIVFFSFVFSLSSMAQQPQRFDPDEHPEKCVKIDMFHRANPLHSFSLSGSTQNFMTYFSALPNNVVMNPGGAGQFNWNLRCGWAPANTKPNSPNYHVNGIDYNRNETWTAWGGAALGGTVLDGITDIPDVASEDAYFLITDVANPASGSRFKSSFNESYNGFRCGPNGYKTFDTDPSPFAQLRSDSKVFDLSNLAEETSVANRPFWNWNATTNRYELRIATFDVGGPIDNFGGCTYGLTICNKNFDKGTSLVLEYPEAQYLTIANEQYRLATVPIDICKDGVNSFPFKGSLPIAENLIWDILDQPGIPALPSSSHANGAGPIFTFDQLKLYAAQSGLLTGKITENQCSTHVSASNVSTPIENSTFSYHFAVPLVCNNNGSIKAFQNGNEISGNPILVEGCDQWEKINLKFNIIGKYQDAWVDVSIVDPNRSANNKFINNEPVDHNENIDLGELVKSKIESIINYYISNGNQFSETLKININLFVRDGIGKEKHLDEINFELNNWLNSIQLVAFEPDPLDQFNIPINTPIKLKVKNIFPNATKYKWEILMPNPLNNAGSITGINPQLNSEAIFYANNTSGFVIKTTLAGNQLSTLACNLPGYITFDANPSSGAKLFPSLAYQDSVFKIQADENENIKELELVIYDAAGRFIVRKEIKSGFFANQPNDIFNFSEFHVASAAYFAHVRYVTDANVVKEIRGFKIMFHDSN